MLNEAQRSRAAAAFTRTADERAAEAGAEVGAAEADVEAVLVRIQGLGVDAALFGVGAGASVAELSRAQRRKACLLYALFSRGAQDAAAMAQLAHELRVLSWASACYAREGEAARGRAHALALVKAHFPLLYGLVLSSFLGKPLRLKQRWS